MFDTITVNNLNYSGIIGMSNIFNGDSITSINANIQSGEIISISGTFLNYINMTCSNNALFENIEYQKPLDSTIDIKRFIKKS